MARMMEERTSHGLLVSRYDRLAKRYDRKWSAYIRQTLECALDVLHLSGTERVLDVGCGTGEFERMAVERFPRIAIIGVDVSPGMIAVARQKLLDRPQAHVEIAQVEYLPFGRETFDAVVCLSTLHHLRHPQQILEECVRVLRPEGRLALVDWCRDFWHCRLLHWWLGLVDRTYVKMFRLGEVGNMLDDVGLVMDRAGRFMARPFYGMMWCIAEKIVNDRHHGTLSEE